MSIDRRQSSYSVRVSAAEMARDRTHPAHKANGDEQKYATCHYPMSFTKGLCHDATTGLLEDPHDFMAFRQAIDDGFIDAFTNRVRVPDCQPKRRQWEAPTAGTAYDMQGPDCQAITMAPAPAIGSDELSFEIAEVYELALLRDEPLSKFEGVAAGEVKKSIDRLNAYGYATSGFQNRPRKTENKGTDGAKILTGQTAFRGSSPGVEVGPYLSQFLWIGNGDANGVKSGNIAYGPQQIPQQVRPAKKKDDYMVLWADWLDVQQGCDVNAKNNTKGEGQTFNANRRFICTPRDMATYVHTDALYQAYLNACLILLGMKAPFDSSFSHLSGMRNSFPSHGPQALNAGGFALYGGPHILTLVTEVATRALKAARFQKFNTHIRARPEVLAARLDSVDPKEGENRAMIEQEHPQLCGVFSGMSTAIDPTLDAIRLHNKAVDSNSDSVLLPMAFAEGSPMHPAYAAGHATVAGACVTVLKAFFDTGSQLVERTVNGADPQIGFFGPKPKTTPEKTYEDKFVHYVPNSSGSALTQKTRDCPLTLEGELNKLAANISIARNMAGVHYFSDYYDSLRMGEEIAIGMLEEQAICYPTDPFVMSVQTFDGDTVRIGAR